VTACIYGNKVGSLGNGCTVVKVCSWQENTVLSKKGGAIEEYVLVHEYTSVRVVGYVSLSRSTVRVGFGVHVPQIVALATGKSVRIDSVVCIVVFLCKYVR
jgi:hypothetical protein